MFEIIATPGWNTAATPLAQWVEALERQGLAVLVTRESTAVSWIEMPGLRLRGYVVTEGVNAEAINFELAAGGDSPARAAVAQAAEALGWQLDDEQDDEDDD